MKYTHYFDKYQVPASEFQDMKMHDYIIQVKGTSTLWVERAPDPRAALEAFLKHAPLGCGFDVCVQESGDSVPTRFNVKPTPGFVIERVNE